MICRLAENYSTKWRKIIPMSKRWTQADIDNIRERGIRIVSNSQAPQESKATMQALGRLKSGEMNKTEAAYAKYLELQKQAGEVLWYEFEPMNLKLADKCFYKVDFLVLKSTGHLEVHEVKGFWTDDALVKIKTAAAKFPFRFISVKLEKGGWSQREF